MVYDLIAQVPTWVWVTVVIGFASLLKIASALRGPKRSNRSQGGGSRGPRDSRGPGWHQIPRSSPGRYGPSATRDLRPEEVDSLRPAYAPATDHAADPGEIVWTWVPFAEGDGNGKDRPVLVIARIDLHSVAGCYLSTKQHRDYISLGTGVWDPTGRESFVAPIRVLRVSNAGVRREGHVVPRDVFDRAVAGIAAKQRQLRSRR